MERALIEGLGPDYAARILPHKAAITTYGSRGAS